MLNKIDEIRGTIPANENLFDSYESIFEMILSTRGL